VNYGDKEKRMATGDASGSSSATRAAWIMTPVVWLAVAALGLLTTLFAHWTATSGWSFPHFLLALPIVIYAPGRAILDSSRVRVSPLEHLTLSLLLGMVASSMLYWVSMRAGIPSLFIVGMFGVCGLCLFRLRRDWRTLVAWRPELDASHWLLAGLVLLVWATLAIMPIHYGNLSARGGHLSVLMCPADVALHLSIANELTHTVPPQMPFYVGRPLNYHYAMDLVAALLNRQAGVNVLDLTVRFLPTFFFTLTLLAAFCFGRAWLGSGPAAVLAAFLVIFGEDWSFIPGLLRGTASWWSICFFGAPTTCSLYWINPMLPGLGLLFGGLFSLLHYFRQGGRGWLALAAFFFAMVVTYKVFIAAHVLLGLGVASVVYLAFFRDVRFLKVTALTCVLVVPLALPMWQANNASKGQLLLFRHDYLPMALAQLGLATTSWGQAVMGVLEGKAVTGAGLSALVLVAVPLFLCGILGLRVVALPVLVKDLLRPSRTSPLRLFLAAFVVLGLVISMTCAIVDSHLERETQYNNAIWFLLQSKYVVWILVVELLLPVLRSRRRVTAGLALAVVLGLSLPSTIQFFQFTIAARHEVLKPARLDNNELAVVKYLNRTSPAGSVVLAREESALPLTALTRCRLPVTARIFLPPFVAADDLRQRREDRAEFWKTWAGGQLRSEVLERYKVDFLLIDKQPHDGADLNIDCPHQIAAGHVVVRPCFENAGYWLYRVERSPVGP
jgi:hypothetical protein